MRSNEEEILSQFFNYTDSSLTILGPESGLTKLTNTPFYNDDGSLRKIESLWMDNSEVIAALNLADFDNAVFTNMAGYGDWLVLSERLYRFSDDRNGRVIIVNTQSMKTFELVGDVGDFLGEHIWIGSDSLNLEGTSGRRQLQDEEEEASVDEEGASDEEAIDEDSNIFFFEPDEEEEEEEVEEAWEVVDEPFRTPASSTFSHLIVGLSLRSLDDNLDHLNFYKIIELDDGTYKLFDFGLDVISANLSPGRHLDPLPKKSKLYQAGSIYKGSFMWTEEVSNGVFDIHQL